MFQVLLYQHPGFTRSNEVHLRLALMRKIERDLPRSLKYFKCVLNDQSPCSFSPAVIKFHIAHLYEVLDRPTVAKEKYDELLKDKDLSPRLRATVNQQIGM